MEFIGIGDLHLTDSAGKGGLSKYIKDHDQFVANLVIDQPLKYASKNGIQNIILYGDIFESPRGSYSGQKALLKILRQNFEFHIILGNHDKFASDSNAGHSLELIQEYDLPNVHIYDQKTIVKFGSTHINFMPWPCTEFESKMLNVCHVDVAGAKSDSGRVYTDKNLSDSKAITVAGHIHTEQKIRNTYYSGTLYQTNFGESSKKFFHKIEIDKAGIEIHNIPVKLVYELHSVEIDSVKDLKFIPSGENHLVKLILKPGCGVQAKDYAHLNVVRVRPVSSLKDLESARIEDLSEGEAVRISSDEFFKAWLRNSSAESSLKKHAYKLRKQLLEKA